MMKTRFLPVMAALFSATAASHAVLTGPYTADANTLVLYNFDQSSGPTDPGNPFTNAGTNGAAFDLTNTGGPDGRSNTTTGGYGGASYTGFGSSFDVLNSGNGAYSNGSATAGGAATANFQPQSALQGASGAFTWEAIVSVSNSSSLQLIISHDGDIERGAQLYINGGNLVFYTGGVTSSLTTAIPVTGEHAFVADDWYHVAVAYTGDELAPDNVSFYWTALDSSATEANLLNLNSLASDLDVASDNWLAIGTTGRSPYRYQPIGFVDEVRISNIARGADDFLFVVPEPGTTVLLGLGGLLFATTLRRRGQTGR